MINQYHVLNPVSQSVKIKTNFYTLLTRNLGSTPVNDTTAISGKTLENLEKLKQILKCYESAENAFGRVRVGILGYHYLEWIRTS